jgi:hypothetical protein
MKVIVFVGDSRLTSFSKLKVASTRKIDFFFILITNKNVLKLAYVI